MTARSFSYGEAQWRTMAAIVGRAGGAVAKFEAQRAAFEKMAGGWKERIEHWDGSTLSDADAGAYERVGFERTG